MSSIREALETAGAEMGLNEAPEVEEKTAPVEAVEPEEIDSDEEALDADAPAENKSPEVKAETASPAPEAPATPEPAAPVESVEPPQFWKAEHKGLWSKIPAEAHKAIVEYENQRNAWANRIANEVSGVRQFQKQFDAAVEPHVERLKLSGVNPVEAFDKLLRWSDILDDEATRINGFNRLLASYGLTPEHLLGQEQEPADPVYSQLNSELSELKAWKAQQEQQRQAFEQEQQTRAEQQLVSEVESVRAEKDEKGNPKFPRLDLYTPQMAQIIPNLLQQNPGARASEIVRAAYQQVDQLFQQQFGVSSQPVQPDAEKQRIERVKRAASMNVSSKPAPEIPSRPKNVREALREAYGELQG